MLNNIGVLASFFVAGILFVYLKKVIVSGFKVFVKGKVQKKKVTTGEIFNWKKARKGLFSMGSSVEWMKSIKEILDIRKLTIYLTVIGIIFAYGWFQGRQDTPVQVELGYGREAYIQIDKTTKLHIAKNGYVYLKDKKGNIIKQISVKDMEGLRKKLSPIGLEFSPIAVVGYGVGSTNYYYRNNSGMEAGAGVSFLRYWQGRVDAFITNRGVYIGTSYRLDKLKMSNSSIGVAIGKGFRGDSRGIVYWSVKF